MGSRTSGARISESWQYLGFSCKNANGKQYDYDYFSLHEHWQNNAKFLKTGLINCEFDMCRKKPQLAHLHFIHT
jgi:hypothetical protein